VSSESNYTSCRPRRLVSAFFLLSALLPGFQFSPDLQAQNLESYRKYALTHDGNVARGVKLFNDEQRLGCSKCHSTDGSAGKAGPDLFAAGDKFGRRDLVDSVLLPSARIAPGYETYIVETKSGAEFQGVLKQVTDAGLQIMGADGRLV
jgi:putative heme-binding domain-containing protein